MQSSSAPARVPRPGTAEDTDPDGVGGAAKAAPSRASVQGDTGAAPDATSRASTSGREKAGREKSDREKSAPGSSKSDASTSKSEAKRDSKPNSNRDSKPASRTSKPDSGPSSTPGRRKPGKTDADILAQAKAELDSAGGFEAPTRGKRRQTRRRHWLVLASFLAVVVLPTLVAGWYLYTRAVDQYASVMAFTVRSEDSRSALDVLGRLGGGFAFGGGAASTDGEILYQFIQSQEMVAAIDAQLDLRSMFARHHDIDPVFGFRPGGTIEDLTDHWGRKLRIAFDTGTGLMEIRVLAFDPHEARTIAQAILDESTRRINELSAAARADATRHTREDLDLALERLRTAREAVTEFRIRTQIVDPSADLQGQMGVLNTLQGQLAAAMIELDLLRENTRSGDPRITQAERRIEVIRARIADERLRIGGGAGTGSGSGGEDYATVMAEFERLNLDREFAEQAYRSALSAFDAAMAEAQRNSRYLATHVAPTLAESARYPEREMLLALVGFFLLLGWAVAVLIYYSVRDSR